MAKKTNLGTKEKPDLFDPVVKCGSKSVDFSKAVPIALGDWVALERQGCVIMNAGERKINIHHAENAMHFVAHFARKADETCGPEDVLGLSLATVSKLVNYIQSATENEDPNA